MISVIIILQHTRMLFICLFGKSDDISGQKCWGDTKIPVSAELLKLAACFVIRDSQLGESLFYRSCK